MSAVHPIKNRTPAHKIKQEPMPERFARGWHCLGLAEDYKDGKPHSLNVFGTKLVAFQGEDGEVAILDGYCPHMGADLGQGCVEGNSVVCPFHHWKWGSDGICKDIPYAKRIPPKARVKSWPAMEENNLLFVWNDPEGSLPNPGADIPHMKACFSDKWSSWLMSKWVINTNVRELVDNISDSAHFGPVHGAPCRYFCNTFKGHVGFQMFRGSSERLAGDSELTVDNAYFGPAYHVSYMTGEMQGQAIESILLNCHVPIDQNSFELRFGVMVKMNPNLTDEENKAIAQAYSDSSAEAFSQDVAIWHTKTRVDNPLLSDGDGPIYQMREWYKQFYTDVAKLPSEGHKQEVFEWRKEAGWRELDEVPELAVSKLREI